MNRVIVNAKKINWIRDMEVTGRCKRVTFGVLAVLGCSCLIIFLVLLTKWHVKSVEPPTESISAPGNSTKNITNIDDNEYALSAERLEPVLNLQRKMILQDMKDYQYPDGRYNISAEKLEDLLIEENGRPIRNIILTTWRTGSTFLGNALSAHPATFYVYEPLSDFYTVQIRGSPLAAKALERVRALFNCEYANQDGYIEYVKMHSWAFREYNKHLWKQCQDHQDWCHDHKFLTGMCKLFPFHLQKLVRLRLSVAQEFLADEKLPVRMVLLVRDPRGIVQSRKDRSWCTGNRDCSDPSSLCEDLVSDYQIAKELLKKYPTTFKVIRYEDLADEPYERVKELTEFYGINFHKNIKEFLDTHTNQHIDGVYSTFRETKKAPFQWKTLLKFEEVEEIQQSCALAMKYWGYVPAINATHQTEFNPVTNYMI